MNSLELAQFILDETDDTRIFQTLFQSDEISILEDRSISHSQVREFFASKLNISASDIVLVGSAKIGHSLSPHKLLRRFDPERSDIDLVLVAPTIFETMWNALFEKFYSQLSWVHDSQMKDVFKQFVTVERSLDAPSEALRDWHVKMDETKHQFFVRFGMEMDIKYRIYKTWKAVEYYHIDGIRRIRPKLKEFLDAYDQ